MDLGFNNRHYEGLKIDVRIYSFKYQLLAQDVFVLDLTE